MKQSQLRGNEGAKEFRRRPYGEGEKSRKDIPFATHCVQQA
jgi:hypothetical protein